MVCIFCGKENEAISVEHIVPESLGNKHYEVQKSRVCDDCNSRFSNFEKKALGFTILSMERSHLAVPTKQGKAAKGRIGKYSIEGDSKFRKGFIKIDGFDIKDLKNFNPYTGTGELIIPSFDKTEVPTSRLLLKIGLESIFTSQKRVFSKYDFTDLKNYLTVVTNNDWPFLTSDFELIKFSSVPTFLDKYRLSQTHCTLKYAELDNSNLLFKFKYGGIAMTINLLNRNLDWIRTTLENDLPAKLYPIHFRNRL